MAWQSASKDLELARSSASEAEQKELRAMKSGVLRGPDGSKHAGFGPTSALFYLFFFSYFFLFLSYFYLFSKDLYKDFQGFRRKRGVEVALERCFGSRWGC